MLSQVLQREGNTSTIDTRFGASRLKSVDPDMSSASVVVIAYLGPISFPFSFVFSFDAYAATCLMH